MMPAAFGCLLLFLAVAFAAPQCVPSAPYLSRVPMCSAYLAPLVYADPSVPTPPDQFFLAVYQNLRTLGLLNTSQHGGASRRCFDLAAALMCTRLLPPCVTLTDPVSGSSVPAFQQPCMSTCTQYAAEPQNSVTYAARACNTSVISGPPGVLTPTFPTNMTSASIAALLPACSGTNALTTPYIGGQPLYGNATWTLSGSPMLVACVAPALVPQTTVTFPCNPKIYQPTDPNNTDGGYCELICPAQWNDSQRTLHLMVQIWAWPAMFLAAFTLIMRLTVPRYCVYPTNLILIMLFASVLFFISVSMIVVVGDANVNCYKGAQVTPANRTGYCVWSAIFYYWFELIWPMCWTSVTLHSAVAVVLKRPVFNLWTEIGSVSLLLLVPIAFTGAVLSNDVQNGGSEPWCQSATLNTALAVTVFYVPILACTAISAVCLAIIAVQFARVTDTVSAYHISNNLRLIGFMAVGMVGTVVIVTYRLYYSNAAGTVIGVITSTIQNYFRALIQQPDPTLCCNRADFGPYISDSFLAAELCVVMLTPCIACVIFLSQKDLWTGWKSRIAPWTGILLALHITRLEDTTTSTTAGSSSTSSSASGTGESTFMSDLS